METAESKTKSGYRFPQWNFRYVMILAILMKGYNLVDAKLYIIPQDTVVRINDSTYFNCSTSLTATQVQWLHGKFYVYTGNILEPYDDGRFLVEINASTGASNLIIRSVQPSDAGAYECVEDEGLGEKRTAELIVIDDDPVCKSMHLHGVIGPNSCGIEPEEVRLSCSIKYYGNSLPVLQWQASDDNQPISDGRLNITSINNEVTYMLIMKSSLALNNASFICQTKRTSDKHYSCSHSTIQILYVFDSNVTHNMTMNDRVSCFANASQLCRYKWKWFSGDDSSTESDNPILKPKKVGWHRCEATCSFGGKSCIVNPLYANVYSDEASSGQKATNGQNRMLFLLLLVPAFAVIGVITYCWRKKHKETQNVQKEGKGLISSFAVSPMCINLIGRIGNESVDGVTKLRNEIYVCFYNYKSKSVPAQRDVSLCVYEDRNPFRLTKKIDEQEIADFYDIGSSENDNCVYLSDCDGQCIKKMTKETNDDYKIIKWLTIENYRPTTLSVSRNGHLLLHDHTNLMIYGADAELIRSIQLPSVFGLIYHAVETYIGNFIILHRMEEEKIGWPVGKRWLDYAISVMTSDGQTVVRRFVSPYKGQVGGPTYLSLDSSGQVFLADTNNARVILFDSDLARNQILCSNEGGRVGAWPSRMFYDEENKQLIVGGFDEEGINVYSLSPK